MIAEYSVSAGTTLDKLQRTYAWGIDLASSLTKAGGVGALLQFANTPTSQTYLPTYDGNGNVASLVNLGTGTLAASYEYTPFGEMLRDEVLDNAVSTYAFKFSTKWRDAETGWSYYGRRYYDARNGRFVGRDPIEEKGGINLYAFVQNNPISSFDAFGLLGVPSPYGDMLDGRAVWIDGDDIGQMLRDAAILSANKVAERMYNFPAVSFVPESQGRDDDQIGKATVTNGEIESYTGPNEGAFYIPVPIDAPSSGTTSILQHDTSGNIVFTPQGSAVAVDPSRAGPATLQPGTLTTTNGFSVTAYQNQSNNMAWNCDCHGFTVANGQFWIDNGDMQTLLSTQTYLARNPVVVPTTNPTTGDWVVYRVGSDVVHSGVITSPGQITMAAGTVIYAGPSKTTVVPIGQGWTQPGTTTEYWHPQAPTPRPGTPGGDG